MLPCSNSCLYKVKENRSKTKRIKMMTVWLIFAFAAPSKSETFQSFNVRLEPDGKEVGDRNDVRVDIMRYIYSQNITVDGYYARLSNVTSARLNLKDIAYDVEFTLEASNCPTNRSLPRDHIYTSRCKGYGSLKTLFCNGKVRRLIDQKNSRVNCERFPQHHLKRNRTEALGTTSHNQPKKTRVTEEVSTANLPKSDQEKANRTKPLTAPQFSRDRERKDDLEYLLASLEASQLNQGSPARRRRGPSKIKGRFW